MSSQATLIRLRIDEKIRLEEERHRLDMIQMEEDHRQQLEIHEKNMVQMRLELETIKQQQELYHLQRILLKESMDAGKIMAETKLTQEPFDEERFVTVFIEKLMEMEAVKKKLGAD